MREDVAAGEEGEGRMGEEGSQQWEKRHCYRNLNLFWLENLCCPGFPTGTAKAGQKSPPFCPGLGNRDK